MYLKPGGNAALSANAHHGVDQQTCEAARAYHVASSNRCWSTPWWALSARYLYDGKTDHPPGWKTLCDEAAGLYHGLDVCYTPIRRG
jgi:ethanolamine ammonia-lyase large subunit